MPPPNGHLRLLRPAVIEIRYDTRGKFKRDVRFYRRVLGLNKPAPQDSDTIYSFPVGMIPIGWKKQDMELRLVLQTKKPIGKKRTIIYWEVSGGQGINAHDSLQAAIDTLTNTTVRPRYILAEKDVIARFTTGDYERALLADGNTSSENLVGLVVNPPFPRLFGKSKDPTPVPATSHSLPIGIISISLLIGLLAGWGLNRLLS
jgi:hypothetical protein